MNDIGDMNSMFQNISIKLQEDTYHNYTINILSKDPWLITIDNFLTEEETNTIIDITNIENKWENATLQSFHMFNRYGERELAIRKRRQSSYSWCYDSCMNNSTVQSIINRIQSIVNIPFVNFENMQVCTVTVTMIIYSNTNIYDKHVIDSKIS